MKINNLIRFTLLFIIILGISGCSSREYIDYKWTLYKKRLDLLNFHKSVDKVHYSKYEEYKQKTMNITRDGYIVSYDTVTPYFKANESDAYGSDHTTSTTFLYSWSSKYEPRKYRFKMYTINKEAYDKYYQKDYDYVSSIYDKRVVKKNFEGFININCQDDKVTVKYMKSRKLLKTCFAKKIEEDVFLITTFMYKKTKEDKELFSNEIIPTMLKSIKIESTKIYPWKFNV